MTRERIEERTDEVETRNREVDAGSRNADATALFSDEDIRRLNSRWEAIQSAFVEEPRESVQRADELVSDMMSIMTDAFQRDRRELEHQWEGEGDVSTETLRITLQRYRAFFDRLLSTSR